jgi:lipopolysaccharide heptosyltransferase II
MTLDPAWGRAKKILCIRLDSLGDLLMTTPAIRAIKESLPGSEITLLTSPTGAQPAGFIPEVDEVIAYEAPWMKASPSQADSSKDLAMIRRLKSAKFDAAVLFTVYSQSPFPAALLTYLADIPLRLAHCRENPYHLLTHWVKESEPEQQVRHEVRRHLDLVASIGCRPQDEHLRFQVPEKSCQAVKGYLEAAGLDRSRPWFVLHPGVSAPSRQYPPEHYAQAARQLALEDGWQVVLSGSESEIPLTSQIQKWMRAPSINLAGRLSIDQMAALIKLSPLLIANNTGPVHLAAAVGTPVVVLYALTNPQHTPWQIPARVLSHDVPCKFCYKSICPEGHHNCLRLIRPDEVVTAARALVQSAEDQPLQQVLL